MKKYATDVKIRIDRPAMEACLFKNGLEFAEAVAQVLASMGITKERALSVTVIERTGSLQGKRSLHKIRKGQR